jgi:cyclopropane-fatty-acyl-phospholipid synthase
MSTIALSTARRGFYARIILNLLGRMQQGRLEITMPDGERILLGDTDSHIKADMQIRDNDFFRRCVLYGDIGFGESYVDGDWDTSDITSLIKWFLLNVENAPGVSGSSVKNFLLNSLKVVNKLYHFRRTNSREGSRRNISEHYDLNNQFFSLFLDPCMTYSSGYFSREGMSLQEAQMAKYDRLCRMMKLKPSHHVLEIGSGWGGNAIYMAKNYGCRVTTITISAEQYSLASQRVAEEGLQEQVTVLLQDYRELRGQFDRIVSIEMLEAVGAEFYDIYFKNCASLLKKDGLLALQVITCPDSRFEHMRRGVDWIQKHIFPGSLLPSVAAINSAVNHTSDLSLVDLKEFGQDYATTLMHWRERFNARKEEVLKLGFDLRFIRKWNYYLSYCEAAFAMRNINVMQMVYSRPNNLSR